jgi:nicotinamidase-related amidase
MYDSRYSISFKPFPKDSIMKKNLLLIIALTLLTHHISAQTGNKALLIIDIQDFYFPGGKSALVEPEKAAANAALLLNSFRKENLLVIHVRHNSESGGKINDLVKPLSTEKIISKDAVNCFINTDLLDFLKTNKTDTLVICGMQTHMCVEAATRAASDLGFHCILISDACATKDLKFGERVIRSEDVHYSTLSTLRNYSLIKTTAEYLKK